MFFLRFLDVSEERSSYVCRCKRGMFFLRLSMLFESHFEKRQDFLASKIAQNRPSRTDFCRLCSATADSFWFPGEIIMADKTEEQTAFLRKSFLDPKVGMVGTTQTYDQLAGQFDQVVAGYEYRAHHRVVDRLVSLVGDRNRAEMKIMDLGCGTGLVGEVLYAAGFTQLDGLEPSQGMLDVARSKGIYRELFCAYVALNDEKLSIADNSYDALTIAGSMGVNMVPPEGIYEMHRLVKPGGYVINVVREETVTEIEGFKDKLEPMMQQMEADGKWKLLSRLVFPDYLVDKPGVVFTHQVC
ncbi:hypothetical protein RRG08_031444 [Elysia crispata]|uniref:Methyltransferase type 11 domain-containing protein n=1 Tax=Elysia crispata TaxID=231223 RepID=A0AAE1DK72_9GAST|nr:hypothetical protein RRG08_031444 [Elysia crispata]